MIVGFSKHGTGGGSGPVDYVTDTERRGREKHKPAIVRGDAEHTKQLIDSLDFKWKYTSGVLSFAPNEIITPQMENDIINRFEEVAFAGLDQDQYNILWVRHTHAGHHELHFITPRIELSTGKSLNIKPPGESTREHFDDYRSEVNSKYGLADPTDPDRAKNVSIPNHELKIAAEALRKGDIRPENIRGLIDEVLTQRASQGLIQSRSDVIEHIKQLGLEITRSGKNYITVSDPESNDRWRLKGGLYAKEFKPSTAIERSNIARERDYSKPDETAARSYAERVERHISERAKYHKSRYETPEQKLRLEINIKQNNVASDHRLKSLNRYLVRRLGDDVIFDRGDFEELQSIKNTGERRGENTVFKLRTKDVREDRYISRDLRGRIQNTRGVLNDRTREPLIKRIEELRDSIQRATENSKKRSNEFNQDVQRYRSRKQTFGLRSNEFKETSNRLERSINHIKQSFQEVIKERSRSQRMLRSERSLGM